MGHCLARTIGSDMTNPWIPVRKWHTVESLRGLESHRTSCNMESTPEGEEVISQTGHIFWFLSNCPSDSSTVYNTRNEFWWMGSHRAWDESVSVLNRNHLFTATDPNRSLETFWLRSGLIKAWNTIWDVLPFTPRFKLATNPSISLQIHGTDRPVLSGHAPLIQQPKHVVIWARCQELIVCFFDRKT